MATIYKRIKTAPLPAGAVITANGKGQRIASWTDADGPHKAPVVSSKPRTGGMPVNRVVTWTSPFYSIKYRNAAGKRDEVNTTTTEKKTAEGMAAQLEHNTMLRRRGLIDPVMEKQAAAALVPVSTHLEDFRRSLESQGRDPAHVRSTHLYAKTILAGARVTSIKGIEPGPILDELKKLTAAGRSIRTRNAYLIATKAFTRWLAGPDARRISSDPLAGIKRMNETVDRRRQRRALDDEEQSWLIRAAETGPACRTMAGLDRAMLYRVALGTGLRASELGSLTPESFKLAEPEPTVTVAAGYSKRRREDRQPIHPDLAAALVPWLTFKPAGKPVFRLNDQGGAIIAADMARGRAMWLEGEKDEKRRAEIAQSDFLRPVDAGGKIVDFHALRHTYISGLVRRGASVKVCQELARHSTPTLTIGLYAHTRLADLRGAVPGAVQKPEPSPTDSDSVRATGTTDAAPIITSIANPECDRSVDTSLALRGVSGAVTFQGMENGKVAFSTVRNSGSVGKGLVGNNLETGGESIRTAGVEVGPVGSKSLSTDFKSVRLANAQTHLVERGILADDGEGCQSEG